MVQLTLAQLVFLGYTNPRGGGRGKSLINSSNLRVVLKCVLINKAPNAKSEG